VEAEKTASIQRRGQAVKLFRKAMIPFKGLREGIFVACQDQIIPPFASSGRYRAGTTVPRTNLHPFHESCSYLNAEVNLLAETCGPIPGNRTAAPKVKT
jgi:hypothetical protein